MSTPEDLSRFTATAESGAGFCATKDGHLVMLTPLTPRARLWLHENVGDDATWLDETLVVEERYFPRDCRRHHGRRLPVRAGRAAE